ncbi:MAG: hypothetical protein WED34_02365 [Planctomycetales bacterium]
MSATDFTSSETPEVVANPFPVWLAELAAEAVVVQPDDVTAEARGNLWSFSLSPRQASVVFPADVETFAESVAEARRAWLSAHAAGPMILYWWHDEQSAQLQFSLVSASHGWLPFGCEIVPAASFREVASGWLGSPYLHGIPSHEFRPSRSTDAVPDPPVTVLRVWSLQMP